MGRQASERVGSGVLSGVLEHDNYAPLDKPTFGALKVSPQDAHRHAVSLVISFASVPTFVEPHAGQVGRVGSSIDMQPPVSGAKDFAEATVHRGRNAKKVVGTVADPRLSAQQFLLHLLRRDAVRPEQRPPVSWLRHGTRACWHAVLALLPKPLRGR
jgi:hypothetical protein